MKAPVRRGQGNTVLAHSSRPQLTIDTGASPRPGVDLTPAQSAPVGTRREKGIPPMYQYADRHCEKVSEMMNTPTWRSQRPGPAVVDDSTPHWPTANRDCIQSFHSSDSQNEESVYHKSDDDIDVVDVAGHDTKCPQDFWNIAHEDALGHDGEAMSIVGMYPFLETLEAPVSSAETFIVSAAVCSAPESPIDSVLGEINPFRIPRKRAGVQSKTADYSSVSEHSPEDNCLCDRKKGAQSFPWPVSDSPAHIQVRKQNDNEEEPVAKEEAARKKARDIRELMERDEAIESINFEHVSPRRRRPATPEGERRFRGLLGRLQPQVSAEHMGDHTLVDPAIISIAPRKASENYGNRNPMVGLQATKEQYLEHFRYHTRSDSGYTSPTAYSRPSTRSQSRIKQEASDDACTETIASQHQKLDSNDSGFDSPSKQSGLNPAAKEFSLTDVANESQTKRGQLSQHLMFDDSQLQQSQTPIVSATTENLGAPLKSPGLGFNGLPNHFTCPMNTFTTPMLPQTSPGLSPQTNNFYNTFQPSMGRGPGLCLPGIASPALASGPGFGPMGLEGPFHHQLPTNASCNNPAHQSISPFNPVHVSPGPSMAQIQPFVPPAHCVPQVTKAPMPPSTGPSVPVAAPFIRKNVPKPKVPNTTGQQYWEYVHEMRRMYEPGYAQKSKANQQKRFIKQMNKNGGTTGQ